MAPEPLANTAASGAEVSKAASRSADLWSECGWGDVSGSFQTARGGASAATWTCLASPPLREAVSDKARGHGWVRRVGRVKALFLQLGGDP